MSSFIYFILQLPPKWCHFLSINQQSAAPLLAQMAAHQHTLIRIIQIKKNIEKRSSKTLSARWDREFKHLPWICPPISCKVYFKLSSLFGVMINGFEKAFFFFSVDPPNKGFRINSHHPTPSLMDFLRSTAKNQSIGGWKLCCVMHPAPPEQGNDLHLP